MALAQNIPPLPMGEIVKYLSPGHKMRPAIAGRGWNEDFHRYAPHETAIVSSTGELYRSMRHPEISRISAVPLCFTVTSIVIGMNCRPDNQDIITLGNCVGLKELKLDNCEEITDIEALGNCVHLEKLKLLGCDKISDISALGNCRGLKKLKLYKCDKITGISALGNCVGLVLQNEFYI